MNSLQNLSRVFIFSLWALMAAATVRAESLAEVRTRMEQRLGELDSLKASGAIGENNRGFLEVRDGGPANTASLVAAENADREQVYAAIAEKTKTSAQEVGRTRALKIAAASSPGVWIQDPAGNWLKK